MTVITNNAADWICRQDKSLNLTEGHRLGIKVAALASCNGQVYNLNTPMSVSDAFEFWPGGGVSVLLRNSLSTYDSEELTRLVIAAHREKVRVSLGPWCPQEGDKRLKLLWRHQRIDARDYGYKIDYGHDDPRVSTGIMELTCFPRQAEGAWHERHPGMERLAIESGEDGR